MAKRFLRALVRHILDFDGTTKGDFQARKVLFQGVDRGVYIERLLSKVNGYA